LSKKSKRILALLNDPRHKNRLAGEINLLDQDEPARVEQNQEMKILKEINALEQFGNDAVAPS
jgi:hypothetical protein